MAQKTIFKKIIDGEVPADVVYEDESALVFRDVNPQAPTHVLVVPKREITGLATAGDNDAALLGHLLIVARRVAEQLGLSRGYRLVLNSGQDGGQDVAHLHVHLLGGRRFEWPPG